MFSVWKNHWKKTTLGISQNVNNFVPKEQSVSNRINLKCQSNIVTIRVSVIIIIMVLDLRGCKNGQPVISSKPHFFQGDSSLLE